MATDSQTSRPRPGRPSTRRLATRIAAIAAAVTLVLGGGLALQMSRGADPALRPKAVAAAQTAPPRRIVKTVVIRRVIASPNAASSVPVATASSAPVAAAPAPVTTATS